MAAWLDILRKPRRLARSEIGRCLAASRAWPVTAWHAVQMTNIKERPEEIEGRLIPGHWEGDLILGPAAPDPDL